MSWFNLIIVGIVVAGIGIAIYERRRGKTLLGHRTHGAHDPRPNAYVEAERERAINPPGSHGGMNTPHGF